MRNTELFWMEGEQLFFIRKNPAAYFKYGATPN